MKEFLRSVWDVTKTIAIAAIIVFAVRALLFQPFLVSGASMEPNIDEHNYLIIDELTYRFRAPLRGEVIVFRYPNDPGTFYIKRIIGLPGDRIDIEGNTVRVNGAALDESSYLPSGRTFGNAHVALGQQEYFVMGDNRANSYDSRSWGPLPRSMIVGRALIRLFPFNKITVFEEPTY